MVFKRRSETCKGTETRPRWSDALFCARRLLPAEQRAAVSPAAHREKILSQSYQTTAGGSSRGSRSAGGCKQKTKHAIFPRSREVFLKGIKKWEYCAACHARSLKKIPNSFKMDSFSQSLVCWVSFTTLRRLQN